MTKTGPELTAEELSARTGCAILAAVSFLSLPEGARCFSQFEDDTCVGLGLWAPGKESKVIAGVQAERKRRRASK